MKSRGRIKKMLAFLFRKAGVSIHDRIFNIDCQAEDFALIAANKRCMIVAEYDTRYKFGDLVRLREFKAEQGGLTGRERYYFIKDIIRPGTKGLFPFHCVLMLD